jgi:hypothetical protein
MSFTFSGRSLTTLMHATALAWDDPQGRTSVGELPWRLFCEHAGDRHAPYRRPKLTPSSRQECDYPERSDPARAGSLFDANLPFDPAPVH